jgi:TolA-binding protein
MLHVQALLFEVESTRLAHSADARVPLTDLASGLCNALGPKVASYLSSANESSPQLVAATQPEIQRHLIEGLGHYYNRNYAAAFPAFLAILREDPDHAVAHYWLGMSFRQAGLDSLAQTQFREFLQRMPEGERAREVTRLVGKLAERSQ